MMPQTRHWEKKKNEGISLHRRNIPPSNTIPAVALVKRELQYRGSRDSYMLGPYHSLSVILF